MFIVLLALAAGILGYITQFRDPVAQDVRVEKTIDGKPDSTQENIVTQEFAQAQIAKYVYAPLTLDSEHDLAEQVQQLATWRVGGIVVFGSQVSLAEAQQLQDELKKFPDWRPEIMVDHEGGTVQRYSGVGFSKLPSWQALCAQTSVERKKLLRESLQELRAVGITMVLAPMVDLGEENAVLGTRLCSADADVVVAAASDFISVAQEVGIRSVIKHYPGLGKTIVDSHKKLEAIDPSEEEIGVFSQLLEIYPDLSVMVGHIAIASKDPETPCSLSKPCIGALKESFPKVQVISDALEMGGAKQDDSLANTARKALEAGNDYLLFGSPVTLEEIGVVLGELADDNLLQ